MYHMKELKNIILKGKKMKIKEGFLLREVAGSNIVVPVGDVQIDFNGMMTLNTVGAFVWKLLENDITEDCLVDAVTKEYDIDLETAKRDVSVYINKLREKGIIEG